eukprot:scaffold14.g1316.t1
MQAARPARAGDALWSPRHQFLCARGRSGAAPSLVAARARRAQQQVPALGAPSVLSEGEGESAAAAAPPAGCEHAAPLPADPLPHPQPKQQPQPAPEPPAARRARGEPPRARAGAGGPPGEADADGEEPVTQTIFKLERRGEGWGEEIFPHLVVEQQVVQKNKRRYSTPDPWERGSLEEYLVECGVPPGDVNRVVTAATAWRVTPQGRPLVDRRRRLRVERNVRMVVEHLEVACGVPFGPRGVAAIFAAVPEIMLCKPSTNDRWDRRAVELAAYLHRHGHANENPELGQWVKRQRVARAAGQLSEERLAILASMGFEFGEVAQLTEDWEHRFDQLVDWILWHNENSQHFSWVGYDWGARGGLTARELALWITLQREYQRRGLLPVEALRRFEALHVQWEPLDRTPVERTWMSWLGRLLYVVGRNNNRLSRGHVVKGARLGRPKGLGGPAKPPPRPGAAAAAAGEDGAASEEEEEDVPRLPRRGSAAVAAARARLQAEVAGRRAALATADLRCEPGLRLWLAKQRCLWRRRCLPHEQVLMLQLAGADMDTYTPLEWQALAHTAAALLLGSEISMGLPPAPHGSSAGGDGSAGPAAATGNGVAPAGAAPQARRGGVGAAPAPAGSPAGLPAGSVRLRVRRWVQTQQALLADGRLSAAQLRYMTFLGITWVLSDEVMHPSEGSWRALLGQLSAARAAAAAGGPPVPDGLLDWLRHQHGLAALGWLPRRRGAALAAAGAGRPPARGAADRAWDARLSELLAFKGEHGGCTRALLQERGRADLAPWLAEQAAAAAAGRLPPGRAAQLQAIGAVPAGEAGAPAPGATVAAGR